MVLHVEEATDPFAESQLTHTPRLPKRTRVLSWRPEIDAGAIACYGLNGQCEKATVCDHREIDANPPHELC